MHEEHNAQEEHGQATASLGDDGEVLQIRTRNGFIYCDLRLKKTFQQMRQLHSAGRTEEYLNICIALRMEIKGGSSLYK